MKNIEVTPIINEATIEAIVKEVSVLRESVIASVHQNKCDELCAIYHMIELNQRERERERLQAFTALVSTFFQILIIILTFREKPSMYQCHYYDLRLSLLSVERQEIYSHDGQNRFHVRSEWQISSRVSTL